MAMTKEQQKESSERIMAKMGRLEGVELEAYGLLTKRPEDYVLPDPESGVRVCGVCGKLIEGMAETKEARAQSALEQFTAHQAEHNPSPALWTEAHKRIQAGKDRAKEGPPEI
jgi:hypothetical protein